MLRSPQGLTLCQAMHAWETTLVIRSLTQGQALQNWLVAQHHLIIKMFSEDDS
jgi:hypothetical protein